MPPAPQSPQQASSCRLPGLRAETAAALAVAALLAAPAAGQEAAAPEPAPVLAQAGQGAAEPLPEPPLLPEFPEAGSPPRAAIATMPATSC